MHKSLVHSYHAHVTQPCLNKGMLDFLPLFLLCLKILNEAISWDGWSTIHLLFIPPLFTCLNENIQNVSYNRVD
jgi:hypothetical protein